MNSKSFDPDELEALIKRKIDEAIGTDGSRLQKERERVTSYYNSVDPRPVHAGQSSYISTDVYDAVESMKAQLLETFAGGNEIIKFAPQNAQDVEASRIATEYTNYVLFKVNDGYSIFRDVIHDGLTARVGIVRVYWDAAEDIEEVEFDGLDDLDMQGIQSQGDVRDIEAEQLPDGTYSGRMTRIKKRPKVRIECIAPENFGIAPQAKDLSAFHFCRTLATKAELEEQGFDTSLLDGKKPDGADLDTENFETWRRFEQVDSGYYPNGDDDDNQNFWVYECYVRLTDKRGKRCLYKVIRVTDVILDMEEVDRSPFKVFSPLAIPHSFWGNNFAARVIPTQAATTVLTRSILDHASITSNPRYLVASGALSNARELLDNRLGGIVNVRDLQSVQPLPQAMLNPFVFQTIELLTTNAEESTGISSLSQGLNKDAISSQNSQGMVNDLVNLSQTRQKVVARNFANDFLVPLYVEIYRLVIENAQDIKSQSIEIAGNFVNIDPRLWIERKTATPELHLGASDAQQMAMKFTSLLSMAGQNPVLAQMIGSKGLYNAATKIMQLSGIRDVNNYLTPPEQLPPQQPDPVAMQQLQLQIREVDIQEKAVDVQAQKISVANEIAQMRLMMDKMAAEIKSQTQMAQSHRNDMETASRIDISQRELAMLEKDNETGEPPQIRGIISPKV